ncbi:hypothetical protein Q9L58_008215 [Maublancomyces gigas]|uniref:F-box domain-containing protein n=1 Tax=Discina gigas TaxID=1032678 RepID=A0ABR3GAC2_9PEZI
MADAVLPPEILHLIFENLSAHADFYSLCLVSRCFHGTAIRFLYRRVIVPYRPCDSREAFAAPLAALFSPAQQRYFATGRRKPAVRDTPQPYRELSGCGEFVKYFKFDQKNLRGVVGGGGELVEAAIENMHRLESFVWQSAAAAAAADSDDDDGPPPGSGIVRTPRISRALAAKPNLRHLTLEKFFADTDVPLLHVGPLWSFSFVLESGFASFAHRRFPTLGSPAADTSPAADYDIIRKILQTSAKTLRVLSLRSASNVRPQYNDEHLLFGGAPSFADTSPEELLHLDVLDGLSLDGRLFTDSGAETLARAIDFTLLRHLTIRNCVHVEKLLHALFPLPLSLPRLRRLVIQASQSLLTSLIGALSGLRELVITAETEALDWTAPGGLRRRFSTGEATSGLLDAVVKHADTLRVLVFLPNVGASKQMFLAPAALGRLVSRCGVLRDIRVCVGFAEWSRVVAALAGSRSLTQVYLQQRAPRQPLPECVGVTRAERMETGARGYVRDVVAAVEGVRAVGVAYSEEEDTLFVYRVLEDGAALRRVEGEKRGAFWGAEVFAEE